MILKDDKIVIVGSGCFGLSSAYHLLKAGFLNVTVLDRSEQLPAVDGASNDLNRIVRTSYPDNFYATLAAEAVRAWKDEDEWPGCYHESGVLVIGDKGHPKLNSAYQNDLDLGLRLEPLAEGDTMHSFFPQGATLAPFHGHGYLNRDSGWVNAAKGIANLVPKVRSLGGRIITNQSVTDLMPHNGRITGVRCLDGTIFEATLVILATGAWTASTFPDLGLDKSLLATGQCLAMVQLTEEEGNLYRDCPVFLDFRPDSGYYCFPPNEDNLIKMAIHGAGFTNPLKGVSTPRTIATDPEGGLRIPKSVVKRLRDHFRALYPNLADKPFVKTRLCWYCDTQDEDWIIGFHPSNSGLIIATGDSGHAYKFLPVIGSLVGNLVRGTLEPELVKRFAVDRAMVHRPDYDRAGVREELVLDQLCLPEDLVCM